MYLVLCLTVCLFGYGWEGRRGQKDKEVELREGKEKRKKGHSVLVRRSCLDFPILSFMAQTFVTGTVLGSGSTAVTWRDKVPDLLDLPSSRDTHNNA